MDDPGELLAIDIDIQTSSGPAQTGGKQDDLPDQQARKQQTEADFQRQRAEWRPRIDDGEIYKTISVPIGNPNKIESQRILHAIEELYYLQRFDEAIAFIDQALNGTLHRDFQENLRLYRRRCQERKGKDGKSSS